ncbi:4-hydroxythreonine-4-phosphate dehydrogenase PdxA [uncultured Litoreibacter sp.]|uniref:4-hydroxythreonine-4-phosphate dehydrogenase PdxA n=1 Tax=uncultured Litoreibacter sp. TaxID=1392394 RepID=UPI0026303F3D|nr:4-hydroxythreonine-4-phosphate dehydrogenase PdxA [uncultured Litoreibacter sp.]
MTPICLTCGEPAGVGLEIARKAWNALGAEVPFFLLGDRRHVDGDVQVIEAASETDPAGPLPLIHHEFAGDATPGQPDPKNAQGVIDVIARGVELVKAGEASALCTLPIHKKALKDGAGFAFPGHTEYLAHLDGKDTVVMMLACPDLRVVPVTIHIALADVPKALTPKLLSETLEITQSALQRDFGVPAPRLSVCGLNPHAGEGGAMGQEELAWISDCIAELAKGGMNVTGPWPADTMFHAAARDGYDVAVAMYHDQALIPIKTIDFAGGVNVTLGLDFIRTSPDHGTAFDIAGRGIADPTSTIAALRMARDMVLARTT